MPEGGGMQWKSSQALFVGTQYQDKRQQAQTSTQEVLSKYQEVILYFTGDGAVVQVAQRGCTVCFLGDLQNFKSYLGMVLSKLL